MTAPIETYAIPYHLYRYRSLRRIGKKDSDVLDREMQAIEQNRLWCSDFDSMNDPMEGAFEPSAMVERSRDYAEAAQMIRDGKLNKGMCAFSEARNIELMWAHYADEFRGICISYMFELLRDGLPKRISFTRISYSDSPPPVVQTKDPEENIFRILSTKHYRWQYEREWRLFTPKIGHNRYRLKTPDRIVESVYLGFRMDEVTQRAIRDRMSKLDIPVYHMNLNNYSIDFKLMKSE